MMVKRYLLRFNLHEGEIANDIANTDGLLFAGSGILKI